MADRAGEDTWPLSPLGEGERERLTALRTAVEAVILSIPSADSYWASTHALRRMLVARKQHVTHAASMYTAAMAFRAERQCWRLLDEAFYTESEVMRRYFPSGHVGRDREGYPVICERVGNIDLIGINASMPPAEFLTWVCFYHEGQEAIMTAASKAAGCDRHKMCVIIDMQGLGIRQLSFDTLAVLKRRTLMEESNYPETVKRVLLINTPAVFATVWGVIKQTMDSGTSDKFEILGRDYLPTLLKYIDRSNIPTFLGGDLHDSMGDGECRAMVSRGGAVPAALIHGLATPRGQGVGEEVTLPAGTRSVLTLNVPGGATVTWRWAPFDAAIAFSIIAVPAPVTVSPVTPPILVSESVYGAHILAGTYPFPVVRHAADGVGGQESLVEEDCEDGSPYRTTATDVGSIDTLPPLMTDAASAEAITTIVACGSAKGGSGSWTAGAGPWLVRLAWGNSGWISSKLVCRRVDVALDGHTHGAPALHAADPGEVTATARAAHRCALLASAAAWSTPSHKG